MDMKMEKDENKFSKEAIRNMLDLIAVIPDGTLEQLIRYVKKSASGMSEWERTALTAGATQLVGDAIQAGGSYQHAMQAAYLVWNLAQTQTQGQAQAQAPAQASAQAQRTTGDSSAEGRDCP